MDQVGCTSKDRSCRYRRRLHRSFDSHTNPVVVLEFEVVELYRREVVFVVDQCVVEMNYQCCVVVSASGSRAARGRNECIGTYLF